MPAGQLVTPLNLGSAPPATTGYRAEDTLTAMQKLGEAYRQGLVNANDLMSLVAKPAQVGASIAQSKDAISAANANMEVRPYATENAIGELQASNELRPAVTGLKKLEIGDKTEDLKFKGAVRPQVQALATNQLNLDAKGQEIKSGEQAIVQAAQPGQLTEAKSNSALAQGKAELDKAKLDLDKDKIALEKDLMERAKADPYGIRTAVIKGMAELGEPVDQNAPLDQMITQYGAAKKKAALSALQMKRAETQLTEGPKQAESLRKEIGANEEIKDFRTTATALKGLEVTLSGDKPSGPKDVAAVYQFIKVLDPNSVVKEGEVTLVQGAVPGMDRLGLLVDKFKSGTVLTPETRQQYLEVARDLAAAKTEGARTALQPYLETAKQNGTPLGQVFSPTELQLLNTEPAAGGGATTAAPATPAAAAQVPPGASSSGPLRVARLGTGENYWIIDQNNKQIRRATAEEVAAARASGGR